MKPLLPLISLTVILGVACGASSPLSTLTGTELSIFMRRTSTFVGAVTVSLAPPSGDCPTLSATADLNGTTLPLSKPGGMEGGSFYFIPTSTCVAPAFSYVSGIDSGEIPAGGPMTLTISDSSATMVVKSDDALVFDVRAVPAATRVGGAPLVFEVTRPVQDLEPSSLSFRREGQSDLVPGTSYDSPRVDGGTLVASVPDAGPGNYTWFLGIRAKVAATSCSGVAVCHPLWMELSSQGTFTVSP